eukprot:6488962-Amphidinium_carterae.3
MATHVMGMQDIDNGPLRLHDSRKSLNPDLQGNSIGAEELLAQHIPGQPPKPDRALDLASCSCQSHP